MRNFSFIAPVAPGLFLLSPVKAAKPSAPAGDIAALLGSGTATTQFPSAYLHLTTAFSTMDTVHTVQPYGGTRERAHYFAEVACRRA